MANSFSPVPTQTAPHGLGSPSTSSESWRVLSWRLAQLAEAGYDDDEAVVLAVSSDIDLHRAVDLLLKGCPHSTALRILL
jgi:hypothetical protein